MTALAAILLHSEYQIPLFGLLAKLGDEPVPLVNVRDLIGNICPKINGPIGQTYQDRLRVLTEAKPPQNTAIHPVEGRTAPQYRRNSPTILPWMRTRLGGRMRTS